MDAFLDLHQKSHSRDCSSCPLPNLSANLDHGKLRLKMVNECVDQILQTLGKGVINDPVLNRCLEHQGRKYTEIAGDFWAPVPYNRASTAGPEIGIPLLLFLSPNDTIPALASLPSIAVSQITKTHYANSQWLFAFELWVYEKLNVKRVSSPSHLAERFLPKPLIMDFYCDFIQKPPKEKREMLEFIIAHELGHSEFQGA